MLQVDHKNQPQECASLNVYLQSVPNIGSITPFPFFGDLMLLLKLHVYQTAMSFLPMIEASAIQPFMITFRWSSFGFLIRLNKSLVRANLSVLDGC